MSLNLHRLKKADILWLYDHRCKKHKRRFTEHPQCFLDEKPDTSPIKERVGYLDIETTGLNGNWDYIISYVVTDDYGKSVGRALTEREATNWRVLDKPLVEEFCDVVRDFDRVVVWWGKDRRHDAPFLRTRCLKWNVDFPKWKELLLTDGYDIAKNKLRLHSYRLETVANFLGIPAKGHKLDPEIWQRAKLGDKKSLDYIYTHNLEDTVTLKHVMGRIRDFSAGGKTSI